MNDAADDNVGAERARGGRGPVGRAPWGLRDIVTVMGLALISLAVLYTILAAIISAAGIGSKGATELGFSLVATFLFELCLFGLALAFSAGKYGIGLRGFGFRPLALDEAYLPVVGILGGFLIVTLYVTAVSVLRLKSLVPSPNLPPGIFDSRALIPLAGVEACVVAPLVEESFFRGFIFRGLLDRRIHLTFAYFVAITVVLVLAFVIARLLALASAVAVALVVPPAIVVAALVVWIAWRLLAARRPTLLRAGFGFHSGFWSAALISGLLFAAFHGQAGLLIPFTGVGALFAWLYRRSGSLWANIVAHAGFNLISFTASLISHH